MKLKIFIFFMLLNIVPIVTNAQVVTLRPPSLLEVMELNARLEAERAQKQKNFILDSSKEIEFFSYQTVYSGAAMQIKKANEAALWVQEISLDKGARITSSQEVVSYDSKTGEPEFMKKTISETISSLHYKPTSLINGQFFNPKTQPSQLSFGLKSEGVIRTAGADNRNEKKNILHINGQIAEIIPYSWKNLENTAGEFAMVNLTLDNPKYKNENIGRTYMCLQNPDINNRSSKILVFVAQSMSEPRIEKEIFAHGCTKKSTSKLDSSGSSRLYFENTIIFGYNHKGDSDKRKIPHSLLFFDAR